MLDVTKGNTAMQQDVQDHDSAKVAIGRGEELVTGSLPRIYGLGQIPVIWLITI